MFVEKNSNYFLLQKSITINAIKIKFKNLKLSIKPKNVSMVVLSLIILSSSFINTTVTTFSFGDLRIDS